MSTQPKIDPPLLQARSNRLKQLLEAYSDSEPEAALCLKHLSPLFADAMANKIHTPRRGVAPCAFYFVEGRLRQHPELEEAFADFSAALQGLDDATLRETWGPTDRSRFVRIRIGVRLVCPHIFMSPYFLFSPYFRHISGCTLLPLKQTITERGSCCRQSVLSTRRLCWVRLCPARECYPGKRPPRFHQGTYPGRNTPAWCGCRWDNPYRCYR